jgi:uncharacterized protein YkwD
MEGKGGGAKTPAATNAKITYNGLAVSFMAYNIGGNNYFKLRDIGETLNFGVDWDDALNTITIDTNKGYAQTGDAETQAPPDQESEPAPDIISNVKDAGLTVAGAIIGASAAYAEKTLGSPYRTVAGDIQYRFYGSYSHFTMLGVNDGTVEWAYANHSIPATGGDYTLYTDTGAGRSVYAVSAGNIAGDSQAATEAIIFEATNAFRAFHGLYALKWNDALASASRAHSEDMVRGNYFDHYSSRGDGPTERISAKGYKWSASGENIIAGYYSGIEAVDNWIHSNMGHREQILTSEMLEIGVGCASGSASKYGTYATQNFASPAP